MGKGPLVPFDAARPNVARGYNYALGGKDNFAVDRELHEEVQKIFPLGAVLVRENREFLARAVGHAARHGVTQFIEIGSGLPARPGTHEIAEAACPGARVAYVDNDPVVISHLAALVAHPRRVAVVPGDVRCPEAILASPELAGVIDTSSPFCVILTVILDYVEPARAAEVTAALRAAMPPGSFLILSIGINNDTPDVAQRVIKAYRAAQQVHLHTREQVAGYLAGLEIAEPGLVAARHWRPAHPQTDERRPADLLAGVGRKPA